MGQVNDIARPPHAQERKYRRFALRYPVQVKFPLGKSVSELQAVSQNVSIGGLLLETPSPIPQHCSVNFTMTVQGGQVAHPIELVGEGRVVRIEPRGPGAGFAIAVECNRPISQMENYLAALRG
ncbi:MAG: PilZ domain-containing protein [Acidobacteriia bacterium]|nr:PilZ domain-containing protein [Terriglobia bacterium]